MCVHYLFFMKFNIQELLFEAFSDIINNFGNIEPKTESTFPFQYILLLQRWQSFKAHSSIPEEDVHVRPLAFLYKIQF